MAFDFAFNSDHDIYYSVAALSLPLTLAIWRNADVAGSNKVTFSVGDSAGTKYLAIGASNTGFNRLNYSSADNLEGDAVATDAWQHIVGVFNSTTSREIFTDGTSDASATDAGSSFTLDSISIGVSADSTPFFGREDAQLAEAAVWSVALSDEEIASLANGFCPLFIRPQSLVFYQPLTAIAYQLDRMGNAALIDPSIGAIAVHPPVIYPRPPEAILVPAAAAAATKASLMMMGVG